MPRRGAPPAQPKTYERFMDVVTELYPSFGARFQEVARFCIHNPNYIAMNSVNTIAKSCGVHPSIVVRFAQACGFSGFKPLQAVFQKRLTTAVPGYMDRIQALDVDIDQKKDQGNLAFLRECVVRDIAALQELLGNVTEEELTTAATYLRDAETIFIAGQLRSESIARFLRYLLAMLGRRVILLDQAGGLATEMANIMTPKDVLIAISFRYYAKEVVTISGTAYRHRTPTIVITDSKLSPLARNVEVVFTIPEEEPSFSPSLAAPMSLVLALAMSLAALIQGSPNIPSLTAKQQRRGLR